MKQAPRLRRLDLPLNIEFDIGIHDLVVWLSGNALVAINEVTLRQARLILGWVHHLGM